MLRLYHFATLCYCVFGWPVWSEPVWPFVKFCFTYRLKHLQNTLLHNFIRYCRNTKRSCFAVWFGYIYPFDRFWLVPFKFVLNSFDIRVYWDFLNIRNICSVNTACITSAIPLDVSVCHFYVIFIRNDFHKICKDFVFFTFSIQFIKNTLHIIIFCVSEFFLLCHRQRLLSDLFFFVILEAMSIHTYNYLNNNDLWLSLHRFIDGFIGTMPLLSVE